MLAFLVRAQPPAMAPVPTQPGVGFAMVGIAPQGQLLKEKAVADLAPGNASMLDLSRSDLPGNDRAEIRGVLRYGYSGGANPPASILNQSACNLLPSLEVFDNHTGRCVLGHAAKAIELEDIEVRVSDLERAAELSKAPRPR